MERRQFLKLAAAAGGAITLAAVLSSFKAATFVPAPTAVAAWPIVTVANISSLTNLTPVVFYYPLTNTPNYLVKLGVAANGGIGQIMILWLSALFASIWDANTGSCRRAVHPFATPHIRRLFPWVTVAATDHDTISSTAPK